MTVTCFVPGLPGSAPVARQLPKGQDRKDARDRFSAWSEQPVAKAEVQNQVWGCGPKGFGWSNLALKPGLPISNVFLPNHHPQNHFKNYSQPSSPCDIRAPPGGVFAPPQLLPWRCCWRCFRWTQRRRRAPAAAWAAPAAASLPGRRPGRLCLGVVPRPGEVRDRASPLGCWVA